MLVVSLFCKWISAKCALPAETWDYWDCMSMNFKTLTTSFKKNCLVWNVPNIFPSAAFHKLVIRPGVCQSLSAHKGPCRALLNFTGLGPKHALHQLSMAWVHALYRLGGWRENLKSFGWTLSQVSHPGSSGLNFETWSPGTRWCFGWGMESKLWNLVNLVWKHMKRYKNYHWLSFWEVLKSHENSYTTRKGKPGYQMDIKWIQMASASPGRVKALESEESSLRVTMISPQP